MSESESSVINEKRQLTATAVGPAGGELCLLVSITLPALVTRHLWHLLALQQRVFQFLGLTVHIGFLGKMHDKISLGMWLFVLSGDC